MRAARARRAAAALLALAGLLVLLSCDQRGSRRELRLYVGQYELPEGRGRFLIYSVPALEYIKQIPGNYVCARLEPAPDRASIWVSGEASRDVLVVDTLADSLVVSIPLGAPGAGGAFSPDGQRFLVGHGAVVTWGDAKPRVSIIDTAEKKVVGIPLYVGADPRDVCFDPAGSVAYASCTGEDSLAVLSPTEGKVMRKLATAPGPHHLSVDPLGRWLYVPCLGPRRAAGRGPGLLQLYALPGLEHLGDYAIGRHPSRVTPLADGKRILLSEMAFSPGDSARVRLCRVGDAGPGAPPALEVLREIQAGGNPFAGDLSPDGRWFAVVDAADSQISLIDAQSGELRRQVPLFAAGPRRLAVEAVFAWHER